MEDASSARHGQFYVTNVLEVRHPELKVGKTTKQTKNIGGGTWSSG
jgi:hypothetical protein